MSIPVPEQDPFYRVPAGIASLANGTVLKSREVEAAGDPPIDTCASIPPSPIEPAPAARTVAAAAG